MKKILIGAMVVLLAGAGYYWFTQKTESQGIEIEEILPSDPAFVFEARDIQTNWKKFAATPFWLKIEKLDWDGFFQNTAESPENYEKYLEFKKSFSELSSNSYLQKFFDKQLAVVAYSTKIDFQQLAFGHKEDFLQTFQNIFSSVVVVSRIPLDMQVMELISRFPKTLGSDITSDTVTYKGQNIQRIITSEGLVIAYVRFEDVMVMGLGEDAARNSIDAFLGETETLAQDQRYKEAKSSTLSESAWWTYVNIKNSFDFLKADFAGLQNAIPQQNGVDGAPNVDQIWKQMEKNFSGLYWYSLSSSFVKALDIKGSMNFKIQEINPDIRGFYQNCRPVENASLAYIPKDVVGYNWGSCMDLNLYWEQIQKEMGRTNSQGVSAEQIAAMEQKLGLSIEGDILAAVGEQFGGFLNDIKTGAMFPIPDLGIFVNVKSRPAMDRILAKLGDIPMLVLQEEDYGGIRIQSLFTPLGEMLQPSFAYMGDYLFLTVSKSLMKNAIDVSRKTAPGLAQEPLFQKISSDLTQKSAGVGYLRVGLLVAKISELIEWGNTWANSQAQQKDAVVSGAQKHLDQVRQELVDLDAAILDLEDQIWDLNSRPTSEEVLAQLETANQDLEQKKLERTDVVSMVVDLEGTVADLSGHKNQSAEQRRYLIDNLLKPVLNALEEIPVIGVQSQISDDMVDAYIQIDMGMQP